MNVLRSPASSSVSPVQISSKSRNFAGLRWSIAPRLSLAVLLAGLPLHAQTASPAPAPTSSAPVSSAPDQATPSPAAQQPATPAGPASSPAGSPDAVPPSPPNAAAKSVTGVDNNRYVIGAEDNLQITVWREPSLSGVLPVRPDGMISLVLIGDLKAAGRTPTQLSGDITQQLKKYIQDPSVTVAVTAVNSQKIYLVGEVGHVGPIVMTPNMTPLQAISAAGGPSPYANAKRIYILRGSGAQQQKIPFNYKQALKGSNKQDIILQPGDTIVVP